jgi:hypothetical protein
VAGLSALGIPYAATGLAAAALLGLLWWGGARGMAPFAQIREVLIALLGAGVGVIKAYRGERFQTWTPASSIRIAGPPHLKLPTTADSDEARIGAPGLNRR